MSVIDPIASPLPCIVDFDADAHDLSDYEGGLSRWCHGCGNNAILAAMQRLCAEEQLPPERTVFVSGIGCAARFPHYMGTYGFHGIHGRALPLAEGVKIRRPDLHVFVNTGDGDCCSIGAGHWIHAVRYNMDLTVLMHDNHIYGLTKKQASPTSPRGLRSNTSPRGALLEPLNPLQATLGMSNLSFVAQVIDWQPQLLHEVIRQAFHHHGLSFVIVRQRCPNYLPDFYDDAIRHPNRVRLLLHPDGLQVDDALARRFGGGEVHDPSDLHAARAIAADHDRIAVGILYRNADAPCYEDLTSHDALPGPRERLAVLERELDKFTIPGAGRGTGRAAPDPAGRS